MSAVSILAITAASMIVIGFLWAWIIVQTVDSRAGAGALGSMLCIPGVFLMCAGIVLAVFNGIVAASS